MAPVGADTAPRIPPGSLPWRDNSAGAAHGEIPPDPLGLHPFSGILGLDFESKIPDEAGIKVTNSSESS